MINPKAYHRDTMHLLGPSPSCRITFWCTGFPFQAHLSPGTQQLQMRQAILLCCFAGKREGCDGEEKESAVCLQPFSHWSGGAIWGTITALGRGEERMKAKAQQDQGKPQQPQMKHEINIMIWICHDSIYIFKITFLPQYCCTSFTTSLCSGSVRSSSDAEVRICRTHVPLYPALQKI